MLHSSSAVHGLLAVSRRIQLQQGLSASGSMLIKPTDLEHQPPLLRQSISESSASSSKLTTEKQQDEEMHGPSSSISSNQITASTSASDGRWLIMFQGLVEHQRLHNGSLKVTRTAMWNNQSLYEWIRNNRKHYLNGLKSKSPALSTSRIAALQSIGFDFDPTGVLGSNDAYDDMRWVAMFEGLVEYKHSTGNYSVPVGYLCDNRSLLDWIRHQRSQYSNALKGARPALSKGRTERLLSIGFDLDPTGQRQDHRTEQERWLIMLDGLVAFHDKHQSFILPEGYSHDGRSLFSWARNQRRLYANYLQNVKPALPQDRVDKLREIGFVQARCSGSIKSVPSGGRRRKSARRTIVTPPRNKLLIDTSKVIAVNIKQGRPTAITSRRKLPTSRRAQLTLPKIARTIASAASTTSETISASTEQTQALPSWVVSLAMDSLTKYQTMSPQQRRQVSK
ncbi:hypothetical protein MPSEU_000510600 [Mayamaea pseudoterrestris]|nr:hypothetical protein MPSEU_000510600 [Mayamaea pseudoterrestris]